MRWSFHHCPANENHIVSSKGHISPLRIFSPGRRARRVADPVEPALRDLSTENINVRKKDDDFDLAVKNLSSIITCSSIIYSAAAAVLLNWICGQFFVYLERD